MQEGECLEAAVQVASLWDNGWIQAVFGGLFTSFLFLIIMKLMRPNIKISPQICYSEDKGKHAVKIINKGRFAATDVYCTLRKVSPFGGPGGQNVKVDVIPLKFQGLAYFYSKRHSLGKENSMFAGQISIDEDISNIFSSGGADRLEFHVTARHSFSGFMKVFIMKYEHKSTIKKGEFAIGDNFNIVEC